MLFDGTALNQKVDRLPTFRPRRNQARIDFRPVVWSLRNRPEEWEWSHEPYTIKHKPSDHEFWVGNGTPFYALYTSNECSCRRLRRLPPWRDRIGFHWAFKAWRRAAANAEGINRQFAAHFLTPPSDGASGGR